MYEAVVQPRKPAHHPPSTPSVRLGPPAAVSFPGEVFTTEMAAKVCRSVLLLSRSSGAVAGSLPALVVSSQRHHQHIRPVSPRTSARRKEIKGGRGVGPGGQAGPGRNSSGGGGLLPGLAKEVKLTSLKIFFSAHIFFFFSLSLFTLRLTGKVRHKMSHGVYTPHPGAVWLF